jgi:GntR family transcriptional regulator
LYQKEQLSDKYTSIILEDIKNGIYTNADILPAESTIAEHYGISRTMLRDCLATLEREGFITRKHGLGTFINKPVMDVKVRMDIETEFLDMVKKSGYEPGAKDIFSEIIHSEEINEKLKLHDRQILKVVRTITADGHPAIYCEDYMPEDMIEDSDYNPKTLEKTIFYFMEKYCNTRVNLDLTEVSAIKADKFISGKLEIPSGEAILYLDEIGYNLVGQPVLYSKEYYANEYFHHMILRKKL